MKIYNQKNEEYKAVKVKKPRFTNRFGRTWQWGDIRIDGHEAAFTYDNTWGSWWYFHIDTQWYKVNIDESCVPEWRMEFTTYTK